MWLKAAYRPRFRYYLQFGVLGVLFCICSLWWSAGSDGHCTAGPVVSPSFVCCGRALQHHFFGLLWWVFLVWFKDNYRKKVELLEWALSPSAHQGCTHNWFRLWVKVMWLQPHQLVLMAWWRRQSCCCSACLLFTFCHFFFQRLHLCCCLWLWT